MSFDIRRASKADLDKLNELNPRRKTPLPNYDLAAELEIQHEEEYREIPLGEQDYRGLELWDLIPKEEK